MTRALLPSGPLSLLLLAALAAAAAADDSSLPPPEIRGGRAAEIGAKAGDTVRHPFFRTGG